MILYTATKTETKQLNISNVESTHSVVYLNNVVYDDVQLARGSVENPNLRVLEISFKSGDVLTADDNPLITYSI
jgi:hypothetical protein